MNQAQPNQLAVGIDKKTFWLGVMAVIFAVLLVAHATRPTAFAQPAAAASMAVVQESVDGRDYSMVTAAQADGSEALYVLDKRTGAMAVMIWNAQTGRPPRAGGVFVQSQFGR